MKDTFYAIIGLIIVVLFLTTASEAFSVLERYSTVNKVCVTALDMAESGSTKEEINEAMKKSGFFSSVSVNGVDVSSNDALVITDYSNIRVEVKEDYRIYLAWFYESPKLTMLTKRAS